jgi:transcriptional regulator with XRE-family HTH domain
VAAVATFAGRLRELREAQGLTVRVLGNLAGYSKSYLSDLEKGRRRPNLALAQRLGQALGDGGDLVRLVEASNLDDGFGDPVDRRRMIGSTVAATVGAVAGVDEVSRAIRALAAQVLPNLSVAGWEEVAWEAGFAYYGASMPDLVAEMAMKLGALDHRLQTESDGVHRRLSAVAARLAAIMARGCDNLGRASDGRVAWQIARSRAAAAGQPDLQALVRGHEATVGMFVGRPLAFLLRLTEQGLAATSDIPSTGRAQLCSARAQILAWMGRPTDAARALDELRRTLDRIPASDPELAGSIEGFPDFRVAHTELFVHAATGTMHQAEAAVDVAMTSVPKSHRISRAQVRLHMGHRMVHDGDIDAGTEFALEALRSIPERGHGHLVHALATRVVSAVPVRDQGRDPMAEYADLVASRAGKLTHA